MKCVLNNGRTGLKSSERPYFRTRETGSPVYNEHSTSFQTPIPYAFNINATYNPLLTLKNTVI